MRTPVLRSLFLLPFVSNPGYAISPLETLFYEAGLELAGGDSSCVHFGYQSFAGGHPKFLPENFANLVAFDVRAKDKENGEMIAAYVRKHDIRFVLIFDAQPVLPLFRSLRSAGVVAILAYIGAPISSLMPPWKLMLKRMQVAMSRSKLDGMIFESRAMADLAVFGRGVPERMISIVPLGVDAEKFHPLKSDYAYEAFGFPRERRIVIYSGHMEARKGVHVLIKAAIDLLVSRRRKDLIILICGNRNADECREYERMYEGMGIDQYVKFGGYRSDMVQLYQSCFAGVIPSSGWDSYPRTSLEMAASGLPVVASRLGGLPEAVLDRQTGLLFAPGDPMELANCLESLLEHPTLAAEYGQRGRTRCQTELSLDAQRVRFRGAISKYI